MVEITIAVVLVVLYLVINSWETYEVQVAFAAIIMTIYLVIYLWVPPKLEGTSPYLGQIFGFVPAVSFAAILFPDLSMKFPVGVTRFLGWIGLSVVLSIICVLKMFIW